MRNYHLPKPVVTTNHTMIPTPNVQEFIQLPPLRLDPSRHRDLQSSGMERQPSVSSTASSSSGYYSTPSTSPTTLYAPMFGGSDTDSVKHSRLSSYSNEHPFHGHRCQSCLDHGEHVPTELDMPCRICGTVNTGQRRCGKATRKKRNDRHLYSKLLNNDARPNNASKAEVEGGNRHTQTELFGRLQNQLLKINPRLPKDAAIGPGRKNPIWKPLSNNNICKDVDFPLLFNKMEILISNYQVIRDSDVVLHDIIHAQERLELEILELLRSKASEADMRHFLLSMLEAKWADRIAESISHRGSNRFRTPFGSKSSH